MSLTRDQHLDRAISPKRILSLDGGGIRGILTVWEPTRLDPIWAYDAATRKKLKVEVFNGEIGVV